MCITRLIKNHTHKNIEKIGNRDKSVIESMLIICNIIQINIAN